MKIFLLIICILFLISISDKLTILKNTNKTNVYVIESAVKVYKDTVKVTGYNATVSQCDSTPDITASNKKVRLGMVALSRDLEKEYDLKFGDFVYLEGYGLFEFQDRLHKRKSKQVDILCWNIKTAYKVTKDSVAVTFIRRF